jgi:hypothetical protein
MKKVKNDSASKMNRDLASVGEYKRGVNPKKVKNDTAAKMSKDLEQKGEYKRKKK